MNRRNLLKTAGLATVASAFVPSTLLASCANEESKNKEGIKSAVLSGKRTLGSLEVSAIGMGVQNMHRKYTSTVPYRPDMIKILQASYDKGVTFFDTAEAYGPHENERILGEAIQSFRNDVVITSKFGWNIDLETGQRLPGLNSKPEHIKKAVEGMLKRLRTDRIDLLYQHRVDPEVPIEDVAGAVKQLMDEGKVLHWGLSEPGLQTVRRAHAELPLTAIQNEYSMIWREPENDIIPLCEELRIGFVPWWPLACQLLTGSIDEQTRFAPMDIRANTSRYAPENLPQNLKLVEVIKSWAKEKNASPAQISLAWLQAQKPFIVPIPGTTQMAHMEQNIGADNIKFTTEELNSLNSQIDAIEIKGLRLPEFVLQFSKVEAPKK
ncbi:aldo/keto reductase [Formosa sp. A9]|uniref:aldo/keto reductase n=1 Tax=Formosa sp. A9 TaxID=3442641 RepID=UPI003EB94458